MIKKEIETDFKGRKKFFNKDREDSRSPRDGDRKGSNFKGRKKFFNKDREDSRSPRDGDRKGSNFKGRKSFYKIDNAKPALDIQIIQNTLKKKLPRK